MASANKFMNYGGNFPFTFFIDIYYLLLSSKLLAGPYNEGDFRFYYICVEMNPHYTTIQNVCVSKSFFFPKTLIFLFSKDALNLKVTVKTIIMSH